MKKILVCLLVTIIALMATACSRSPDNTPPEKPTTAVSAIPSAQPSSTPLSPTEAMPSAMPQVSATAQPTVEQPPTPTPAAPATNESTIPSPSLSSAPPSPPCLDEAVYVGDISVPDGTLFRPGEAFTKTWRVRNTGTCTWGAGYSLAYTSGDIMSGEFNNPIGPISPGELADITVDLVAPARGGEQIGYWQFQNASGKPFGVGYNGGYPFWVKINVAFFNPNPQPTVEMIVPALPTLPAPTPSSFILPTPTPRISSGPAPTPIIPSRPSPTPAVVVVNPTEPAVSSGCAPQQNDSYVDQMLTLINQARAENNLQPVFLQSQLTAAAIKHSTDMACNRFVDHHGSDGSTWSSRVQAEGYANPRSARENIKVGTDVQETFDWWMGSAAHRENILFPSVTEVGIGYVFLPGSPYGSYFTLLLGKR